MPAHERYKHSSSSQTSLSLTPHSISTKYTPCTLAAPPSVTTSPLHSDIYSCHVLQPPDHLCILYIRSNHLCHHPGVVTSWGANLDSGGVGAVWGAVGGVDQTPGGSCAVVSRAGQGLSEVQLTHDCGRASSSQRVHDAAKLLNTLLYRSREQL